MIQGKQEGIHGSPASRNHPCMQPHQGTVTLNKWKKYLPNLNLPKSTKADNGWDRARLCDDSLKCKAIDLQ